MLKRMRKCIWRSRCVLDQLHHELYGRVCETEADWLVCRLDLHKSKRGYSRERRGWVLRSRTGVGTGDDTIGWGSSPDPSYKTRLSCCVFISLFSSLHLVRSTILLESALASARPPGARYWNCLSKRTLENRTEGN